MANPRQRDPLANTLGSWLETNRGSEPRIRDVVICLGIGDALQPSNEFHHSTRISPTFPRPERNGNGRLNSYIGIVR